MVVSTNRLIVTKYPFLGSKGHLGVLSYYKICSLHDIAEILLKLALNTNQPTIPQIMFFGFITPEEY